MSGRPCPRSGLIRSFGFAFAGIATLLRTQRNARIHACATVAVVAAGFILRVTPMEWCLLALAITGVWVAEAVNTALEFLADAVSPDINPLVKHAKDTAAGAVLIAAIGSATIGLLVFGPRLIPLIRD